MPPTILILGYSEAAMHLRRPTSPMPLAVISIHGAREFGVECAAAHRLDLMFDDVDVVDPADVVARSSSMARRQWSQRYGRAEQVAPSRDDAAKIVHFAQQIQDSDGQLLCHCGAGISRAPAAALICLATWLGLGGEAAAVAHIAAIRRAARPHVGLIALGDDVLGREGKLFEALWSVS